MAKPRDNELLQAYPESIQRLARQARKMLGEWLPEAEDDGGRRLAADVRIPVRAGLPWMICMLILEKFWNSKHDKPFTTRCARHSITS